MSSRPLVSVCIATYNHERFLAQALDSVLMQQGDFTLEILLGEDGSSDNTPAIVRDYAARHPATIRAFFHKPEDKLFINGRQTGRKNFLNNLQQARGDFVALLDGDDYWLDPHKLQKQLAMLQANPQLVACCHAAIHVDDDNVVQDGYMGHHDVRGGFRDFTLCDVLRKNPVPTLSVLFRNPCLPQYPALFLQTDMADWPLHMLNALRGDIRYVDEKMAAYRLHGGGVWAGFRASMEKTLLSEIAVWRLLANEQAFVEHVPYLRELVAQQYGKLVKLALREHDYRKAWHYWGEQGSNDLMLAGRIARKQLWQMVRPQRGAA